MTSERNEHSSTLDTYATGPWPPLGAGAVLNSDNPDVLVYFVGLMGFRYDRSTGSCEIGFHCASPSHHLAIAVYEDNINIYSGSGFPDSTSFELGVMGRSNQVYFYQAPGDIDRSNASFDSHDFRWLVDFEHRDFYNRPLRLKPGFFRKRLRVLQGNFFTIAPTCATFDIIGGPNPQGGIHLPIGIGLSLELSGTECVDLKATLPGTVVHSLLPHHLCRQSGHKYAILFANLCRNLAGNPCPDNDFHKNLDPLDIQHQEKFDLVLRHKCTVAPSAFTGPSVLGDKFKDNTDEAPCMGTGFGSGRGFPPFPPG